MTASTGSHSGSLGKGGQNLREPRDDLASQCTMVDLTLDRARSQNLLGRRLPPRARFRVLLACVVGVRHVTSAPMVFNTINTTSAANHKASGSCRGPTPPPPFAAVVRTY